VGFVDLLPDSDRQIRQHLLQMGLINGNKCKAEFALSTILARKYLNSQPKPVILDVASNQIGRRSFPFLTTDFLNNNFLSGNFLIAQLGGYQASGFDDQGSQIMLNYRSSFSPDNVTESSIKYAIQSKSIQEIFDLDAKQLNELISNKIILIGKTDINAEKISTPYGEINKVFLHAQMTSQLVNAGLENRPLIWACPFLGEFIIIFVISAFQISFVLIASRRFITIVPFVLIYYGMSVYISYTIAVLSLSVFGFWFPLTPLLWTLFCVDILAILYLLTIPRCKRLGD
jgi:CHASE2 domain-containing sensor protein